VFGQTILLVTKFVGRTDLSGTFEGPFNGSLEEVRFGAATTHRRGTGDFQGLVLHGVAVQNPPGSGTEAENGRIVGRDEPEAVENDVAERDADPPAGLRGVSGPWRDTRAAEVP